MQTLQAGSDEDVCGLLRDIAADLQTSIALNRVLVRSLATVSPDCGVAAATAVDDEAEYAQRRQAAPRTVEALQRLQSVLNASHEDEKLARRLEEALIKAADQLALVGETWVSTLRNETDSNAAKAG
jgi:hypothetical protein